MGLGAHGLQGEVCIRRSLDALEVGDAFCWDEVCGLKPLLDVGALFILLWKEENQAG